MNARMTYAIISRFSTNNERKCKTRAMSKSLLRSRRKKKTARRKQLTSAVISSVIIIALAFAAAVIFIKRATGDDKYFLGFRGYITLSGGMEPVIKKGSLLITQRVDTNAIRAGDIITYKADSEILTYRVVDIKNNDGAVSFITKGDANEGENSRPAPADCVIGRFVYAIGFAGNAILAMRNPAVMLTCVAGVCILIITSDIINRRLKRYLRRKNGAGGMSDIPGARTRADRNTPRGRTHKSDLSDIIPPG